MIASISPLEYNTLKKPKRNHKTTTNFSFFFVFGFTIMITSSWGKELVRLGFICSIQSAQTHRDTYTHRDWKFSILLYTTGVTKNLKMCHRIPFIPWLQNHKTRPSQQPIETDLITGFARISTSWDSISMGRGKKVSIYWEEIEQESRFQKLDSS